MLIIDALDDGYPLTAALTNPGLSIVDIPTEIKSEGH